MDKRPSEDMTDEKKKQALFIYRKVTALRSLRCCGMCGTTRHATRPYWCLGKRLCRNCVQANLVSHLVLYDKYWVTFARPVQSHGSFVDAVCMNVFFFNTRLTPNQRLDFSNNRIDFPGGTRTVWFFWRPHLERVLNMRALEREGLEKSRAAETLRAHTRRALVLRAMRGTPPIGRRVPTFLPTGVFLSKRDLRCIEFRLRRMELLDKTNEQPRICCHLPSPMLARLTAAQDRVTPFMYN